MPYTRVRTPEDVLKMREGFAALDERQLLSVNFGHGATQEFQEARKISSLLWFLQKAESETFILHTQLNTSKL